jgi:hypothetical protein
VWIKSKDVLSIVTVLIPTRRSGRMLKHYRIIVFVDRYSLDYRIIVCVDLDAFLQSLSSPSTTNTSLLLNHKAN